MTDLEDIKNALWAGANTFRDSIDAANYKDYVLSMLFVKYLSDTYKESVENLKKDYYGIRLERQIENLPFCFSFYFKSSFKLNNSCNESIHKIKLISWRVKMSIVVRLIAVNFPEKP